MKKLLLSATAAIALASTCGVANALTNTGTVAIQSGGFLPGLADTLLSPITISPVSEAFGVGTPNFNTYLGDTITDSGFNLVTKLGYTFTSADGTFVQGVTPFIDALPPTGALRNLEIFGTWTSTTGLTPTTVSAEVLANFTQVGGAGTAISYGGTLTTTLTPVPEPAAIAMLGIGLLGLAFVRRHA